MFLLRDISKPIDNNIFRGDVVECLSKNIRDAILAEKESKISSDCREQLTFEKLEIVSLLYSFSR